jgi:GMP synthase-like glutamine amidotransferase
MHILVVCNDKESFSKGTAFANNLIYIINKWDLKHTLVFAEFANTVKNTFNDQITHIITTGSKFTYGVDASKELVNNNFNALHIAVQKKIPLLGICFGMQLINVFFGGTLERRFSTHNGTYEVYLKDSNLLHKSVKKIKVYEMHRYVVQNTKLEITGIQKSKNICNDEVALLEFMENGNRIFGTQFHPECSYDGRMYVLKPFLNLR